MPASTRRRRHSHSATVAAADAAATTPYHFGVAATGGNPRQRISLAFAAFEYDPFAADCHWLRLLGSINAPYLAPRIPDAKTGSARPGYARPSLARSFSERDIADSAAEQLKACQAQPISRDIGEMRAARRSRYGRRNP